MLRTTAMEEAIENGRYADVVYRDGTIVEISDGLGQGPAPLGKYAIIYSLRDHGQIVCSSEADLRHALQELRLNPRPALRAWKRVMDCNVTPTSLEQLMGSICTIIPKQVIYKHS